jgi:hypothetical protein
VAEHDDLELLELIRAEAQRRELQQTLEHEVTERPEQERFLQVDGAGDRLYGREPPTNVEPSYCTPHAAERETTALGAAALTGLADR